MLRWTACCICLLGIGCSSGAESTGGNRPSREESQRGGPAANAGLKIVATDDDSAPPSDATTTDVIVVGAGISGLSAALDLGRGGVRVTVVDMSSVFGGHAVMSQGSVSIVATPMQEKLGIRDTPELAFRDFHTWGIDPATDWVRYYVDHSREEIYDWLMELGIRFQDVVASSGNSVPREHQPIGRGIGLVTPIYRACLESQRVAVLWNNQVEQLITSEGRVVGVRVRDLRTDEESEIRGRAVVLATGGFQSNLEMVREFWPAEFRFPKKILAGSGRNSIGLGHRIAQSVGGELVRMEDQWNYFTGLPDPRYPGTNRGLNATNLHGILVNSEAKQFVNFHGWAKEVMPVLLKQENTAVWNIFDEAAKPQFSVSGSDWGDFKKVDRLILQNPDLVKRADTLEELASLTGLPLENLLKTVARHNELVDRGEDVDFGRFGPGKPDFSNKSSPKIATPPFYAMQTFPLTRKSMGGVAIDLKSRVVTADRQPIPGLYAVGELTGLALINGKAALEGTFLGPCIVTGRVAARSLLAELSTEAPPALPRERRCTSCHDMPELLSEPRPGYWHFEKVHQVTQERALDCRQCHGELAPYRAEAHRINRQTLSASCVTCHVAQE
ncbi:MAG: FAD-dependent oxidoreductase [Planctomycetota bacterium]|nr:FAD-dependent oxidoreductase [Planctomycetota bacterium]